MVVDITLNITLLYPEWPHRQGGCLACCGCTFGSRAEVALIYSMHEALRQDLLQLQAWVSTKWSPINSFFSSLILILDQYSVSKIHFYHAILIHCFIVSLCRTPHPHEGGGCDQSIGSTVSDAIVRSWLWLTATRSSPLGCFSTLLQVVDN